MTRGVLGSGYGGFVVKDNRTEYYRAYQALNRDKIKERGKKAYDANPEKFKASTRAYYIKRRDKAKRDAIDAKKWRDAEEIANRCPNTKYF